MSDQNNKLIAEFIGLEKNDQGYLNDHNSMGYLSRFPSWDYGRLPLEQLMFDVDWNWLIYVARVITSNPKFFEDYPDTSGFWDAYCQLEIEEVYEEVVKYIKWYNNASI